jgi:hypothetical protein
MAAVEVVSPLGLDAVQRKRTAPRLADLNGKCIGEVWNGVFKGDQTFPLIREQLTKRYPGVRFVPYSEFPHVPGADNPAAQRERARQIAALVAEKGCDAVISGNGA